MMHFDTPEGPICPRISKLTIAGWTGRNQAAVLHHIEELAELGVPRPSTTPLFYAVSPARLTQADRIAVLSGETSGEAEPFLLNHDGRLWLGLGSDHTDRGLEAHSVAHAKEICPKPVSTRLIPFDPETAERAELNCQIDEGDDGWRPHQSGNLGAILPLSDLLDACPLSSGHAMFCGTLPTIGGVRPGTAFAMTLTLPGGDRLSLSYAVDALPVIA